VLGGIENVRPAEPLARHQEALSRRTPQAQVGPTEDLSVFMGAIITKDAFDKIVSYIEEAKKNPNIYEIVFGGEYDSSTGWFVQPTVIVSKDPKSKLMTEEIFGPVLTVYIYPDSEFEKTLKLCDESTPYGLTGSIFAQDRQAIVTAEKMLRYAAGNFYINDKPTGAVVGRQPFGGARHSGTNDKAGSWAESHSLAQPANYQRYARAAARLAPPVYGLKSPKERSIVCARISMF
jgi:1-pyrroline-5-carboxylate dehydrogenase